jgi:hypothetical protein
VSWCWQRWRSELRSYPVFCVFRHFAQRAFCAARMCVSAVADNLRLLRVVIGTTFSPLAFAQRAR